MPFKKKIKELDMSKDCFKKHIINTQMALDLALIANSDGCS